LDFSAGHLSVGGKQSLHIARAASLRGEGWSIQDALSIYLYNYQLEKYCAMGISPLKKALVYK